MCVRRLLPITRAAAAAHIIPPSITPRTVDDDGGGYSGGYDADEYDNDCDDTSPPAPADAPPPAQRLTVEAFADRRGQATRLGRELAEAGLSTLGEVADHTRDGLYQLGGTWYRRDLNAIEDTLRRHGLRLRSGDEGGDGYSAEDLAALERFAARQAEIGAQARAGWSAPRPEHFDDLSRWREEREAERRDRRARELPA